jgi:hypothetical protein
VGGPAQVPVNQGRTPTHGTWCQSARLGFNGNAEGDRRFDAAPAQHPFNEVWSLDGRSYAEVKPGNTSDRHAEMDTGKVQALTLASRM